MGEWELTRLAARSLLGLKEWLQSSSSYAFCDCYGLSGVGTDI
jgi:hypothetical protein